MESTANLLEIGRTIRAIRKKKGLTQQDVCKGLFSAGKYSRIERGSWNLTMEDLEAICRNLGVQVSDVIPQEPYVDVVKSNVTTALVNIRAGLFEVARSCLEEVSGKIPVTKSMEFYYIFAWGEFYLYKKEYETAAKYFRSITKKKASAFFDQELIIRSYNALSYIAYKNDNISEAAENTESALDYLSSISGEFKRERAITHFNNAIFQCRLKNFEYARDSAYEALSNCSDRHKDICSLLVAFIDIHANTYSKNIKKQLDDLAESFFRANDMKNYFRVMYCQYYVHRNESSSVTDFLINVGKKLSNEILTQTNPYNDLTEYDIAETELNKIENLYMLAHISIIEKDYNTARRFITLCYSFAESKNLKDDLLWAKIYALYAHICSIFLKDPVEEEAFVDKALSHLEKYPHSIERATLLYQKALLSGILNENNIVSEAATIFYQTYKKDYMDKGFLTKSLPQPFY